MIKEFKEFIMRGSVLDLAVGVIIGSAFTGIVNQVVEGLITPLIGLVISLFTDGQDLDKAMNVLDVKVNGVTFMFGNVISAIITFLITAFVLFLIVKAANKAKSFGKKEEEEEAEIVTTESLLTDIRDLLEAQEGKTATQAKAELDRDSQV
ncbi:large conductance mechanosensitive channel protein MscL [Enterococcus asini]|uniref:large conductance mechanosensitive channel protein MscL n=1 Tax=Enterococcus asini TaxID=57732 RepID=UPI00288EFCD5|nr:large conductance mechanosensitive channel protein MscL [Enterococcus asini]MDT2757981.1 large conductance mechanosensitive channel protein MscL [Enterococcus asini]